MSAPLTIADRLAIAPPDTLDIGRTVAPDWLAAGSDDDVLARPEVVALTSLLASTSPYLSGLAKRDLDRYRVCLTAEPKDCIATLCVALRATAESEAPDATGLKAVMSAARKAKSKAALLIALADIAGLW
ncbi:MAG: hypothetical protein AAFY64_11460, partial [Pseudomonadota bacterium]